MTDMKERVALAYERHGGNISAMARELKVQRSTIRSYLRKLGKKKPLVGGSVTGVTTASAKLPPPGQVKRYILTSAQNNTRLHDPCWEALLALSKHYDAKILVGTYSYNKNAYGPLAVKRGSATHETGMWYDERLRPYFSDARLELAPGLVWCGEMNIQPTAVDPLEGLETYSGRKSAIFPCAKHAMRSIAAFKGEDAKLNFTTGTVTQRNYIQKKAGLKAEHHHSYGAVIVEVDSDGCWWVRQLDSDEKGRIQDLNVLADGGKITTNNRVEAITWGDLHATCLDESVSIAALGDGGMLRELKPRVQFIHDLLEGVSVNHHGAKDPHDRFDAFLRGFDSVTAELDATAKVLDCYARRDIETVIVDSNHDNWLMKWLKEHDYRRDPRNAILFLEAQVQVYTALFCRRKFNLTKWAMERFSNKLHNVRFLETDESYTICKGRIECGMHGHLGPNGARGTPANLNNIGRRANTAHTHSAGIFNGLYVAGTSAVLDMGFNRGPSSWSHSHVVTYPTGKRTVITVYAGKWKA